MELELALRGARIVATGRMLTLARSIDVAPDDALRLYTWLGEVLRWPAPDRCGARFDVRDVTFAVCALARGHVGPHQGESPAFDAQRDGGELHPFSI